MEQTRYWMWHRSKLGEKPLLGSMIHTIAANSSYNESWEEQAFAEDSAGLLGGCIWPPRSYSCSFCRREFRSAQALGGHMNVHRRDRARLKQSSSTSSENYDGNGNNHHRSDTSKPLGLHYQHQVGSLLGNTNLIPNLNFGVVAPPLSPRASAAALQENSETALVSPSCFSSTVRGSPMERPFATTQSSTSSTPVRQLTIPELNLGRENLKLREVGCRASRDPDDDDDDDDDESLFITSKRRRTDFIFPSFAKPFSGIQQQIQSEVLKLSPSPVEELDLELRLGDRPKGK